MGFFGKNVKSAGGEGQSFDVNPEFEVSVSSTIPGKQIKELKGVVFGEVTFFPTSAKTVEQTFSDLRIKAMQKMIQNAESLGANAIVDFQLNFAPFKAQGSGWGVSMIVAYGSAVWVE